MLSLPSAVATRHAAVGLSLPGAYETPQCFFLRIHSCIAGDQSTKAQASHAPLASGCRIFGKRHIAYQTGPLSVLGQLRRGAHSKGMSLWPPNAKSLGGKATSQTGHCLATYFECRPRRQSARKPTHRADFMGFDPSFASAPAASSRFAVRHATVVAHGAPDEGRWFSRSMSSSISLLSASSFSWKK